MYIKIISVILACLLFGVEAARAQTIEAASYSSLSSGVATETCSEGGLDVGYIVNGSWLEYNQMNLNGQTTFAARVASAGSGGNINIYLDSTNGTLIGTCAVPVTGGWETWTTVNCALTGASGYHNVYLVFTGGGGNLFNVEWFVCQSQVNGIEAAGDNSLSSGLGTQSCSEGGLNVDLIENGSWAEYNQINLNGQTGFQARVASAGSGGNIQIYLDSTNGTLIGTCAVPVTGGWQTWTTVSCSLSGASGYHNVYLVFTGGSGYLLNLEWFYFTGSTEGFPELVVPSLNAKEMVVAAATPQEYGAVCDGVTDDSAAFQNAINAVYNNGGNGGGVVYVPAGNYAFANPITIPTGVTLHGDWTNWTTGAGGLVGTTFKVYTGAGSTNGTPFITMGQNAALKGINIWYPNQNPNSITPYPFTINETGNNCVVQNVALVNSYLGIEAIGVTEWVLSTVVGTPLCLGLTADAIADICQSENVRFSPAIWAASGLTNAPTAGGAYATWMLANGTGIRIFRLDGLINVNMSISGYNLGMDFETSTAYGNSGCAFYNSWVTNCNIAVQANGEQTAGGLEFSVCTLEGGIGINDPTTNTSTIHCSHCTIIGTGGTAVNNNGTSWSSVMAFQSCTISNALNQAGPGVFNLVDCNLLGSTQCVMSSSATRVGFTGCTFSPSQHIVNNGSAGNLLINPAPSTSTPMPMVDWTNVLNRYVACQPAKPNLFVATSYGATGNGTTDDTVAIQNALNAAGTNGGGIVYLPAGNYHTTNSLSVPSGVELRGAYELRHGTWGGTEDIEKGSTIQPYGGQGASNGPPAVVLAANSGLVGMTFNYQNQTYNIAYPWTVQGRGANVYVIGVQCAEPWDYVDLDTYTCSNHFLYMVDGWALNTWVHAGNGSSGIIADTHGNPTYWLNNPNGQNNTMNWGLATDFGSTNMQTYVLGNCKELFMKVFIDCQKTFMHCSSESGQGPNVTAISAMCDGSYQSYIFDASGPCTLTNVNSEWWCAYGQSDFPTWVSATAVITTTNFQGTVRFLNVPLWGNSPYDYVINGGDVGLELVQLPQANSGVQVGGGVFHLVNAGIMNGSSSPFALTYGVNAGLAGDTNELVGCYGYGGFTASIGNVGEDYSIWNDYALGSSSVLSFGPVLIGDVYPNGAYQFQSSPALTFQAGSVNGINTNGISVQLNGTTLAGTVLATNYTSANGLNVQGASTDRTVSAPLTINTVYTAVIKVTDASGKAATNTVSFDTISPAYTFEAEDFDYGSGNYLNNPQTNAYSGRSGTAGIDYSNAAPGSGSAAYRPQGLETENASDTPRLAYSSGLQDYEVGFATPGNWGNYTRAFPAGTYNIYMRSASISGPTSDSETMYQVTAGRGTTSQTLSLLGTFTSPNTGGWQTYGWVPLKNSSGNLVNFTGGSVETLRVTTVGGGNNINGYMLVATNSAYAIAEAASYNTASSGVATETCSEGGLDAGYIVNGSWLEYNQLNLNGQGSFQARVASGGSGGNVQIWLDSTNGTLVGTCPVPVTGGFQTWTTVGCSLTGVSGYHNVYLVFTGASGYLFNVEWFGFGPQANATEAASDNSLSSGVATETCSEGGLDVGYIVNGSWLEYNQLNLNGQGSFQARVASAGSGGSIKVYLDSTNGTLVGTCTVPVTGGWETWTTVNCALSGASGYHNVYLVCTGGGGNLFNVEWFAFTGGGGIQPLVVVQPPKTSLPPLSIASGAKGLSLQWPDTTGGTTPSLYYTPSLTPPISWVPVTNTPVLSNGQWMVALPAGSQNAGFYELQ